MAFYTIFIPASLPEHVRREVGRAAPSGTYSRAAPDRLLQTAGFGLIQERDVTEEYLRVARAWYDAWSRHANRARATLGAKFDDQYAWRAQAIKRVEDGLVTRSLFIAERPG